MLADGGQLDLLDAVIIGLERLLVDRRLREAERKLRRAPAGQVEHHVIVLREQIQWVATKVAVGIGEHRLRRLDAARQRSNVGEILSAKRPIQRQELIILILAHSSLTLFSAHLWPQPNYTRER